jgi:hypothetical protein
MDRFCTPSFLPEQLDGEFLFLFAHLSPVTVFINSSNLERLFDPLARKRHEKE